MNDLKMNIISRWLSHRQNGLTEGPCNLSINFFNEHIKSIIFTYERFQLNFHPGKEHERKMGHRIYMKKIMNILFLGLIFIWTTDLHASCVIRNSNGQSANEKSDPLFVLLQNSETCPESVQGLKCQISIIVYHPQFPDSVPPDFHHSVPPDFLG